MNKNIKNLWDTALEEFLKEHQFATIMLPEPLREQFAELIVRECIEQLELVRKYRYDRVQPLENQQTIVDECQYQIKQHFGVEE